MATSRLKGTILSLALLSAPAVITIAQPYSPTDPVALALAGSTCARTGYASHSAANPASTAGATSRVLFATIPFEPAVGELRSASAGLGLRSDSLHLSAGIDALVAGAYRNIGMTTSLAIRSTDRLDVGASLTAEWVTIDRYGTTISFGGAAGIIVRPIDRLSFGMVVGSIGMAEITPSIAAGVLYELDPTTRLSIDLREEPRIGTTLSSAIDVDVADDVLLRVGTANRPATASLGVGWRVRDLVLDAAMAYTVPLGVRSALGIALQL